MSKLVFFFLAIALQISLFAQNVSVPYRVGNKFGISDQNGKIIISPQFDIVEMQSYDETYFQAFTFQENATVSSFIYKNKIVLSNQKYNSYHLSDDFIVATKYKTGRLSSYHHDGEEYYTELEHLYTKDGKIIISEDVFSVYTNAIDNKLKLNEVVINTTDKNKKHSLFLYNKKLKKITKTFFEKTDYLKITHNNEYNYRDNSIVYTFKDGNGKGKQIKIDVVKDAIKVVSAEDFDLNPKKNNPENRDDYSRGIDVVMAEPDFEVKKQINPLAILDIKKIEIKRDFYYLLKKAEEIHTINDKLSANYCYIMEKDGKKGMFYVQKNAMLIPQEYDEIIKTDIPGHFGGFLLKKNNKYGYFIQENMSESYFIEPIFDKIPLIEKQDYFGKNQPLIKLFDENNKFFCYANKSGKLYYSEK